MISPSPEKHATSPILIVLAWAIVGIPWLWGVSRTLENAAKLFQ